MRFIVLLAALTVFFLVVALFAKLGKKLDRSKRRLNALTDAEPDFRDEELKKSFAERVLKPAVGKLSSNFSRIAVNGRSKKVSKSSQKLEKQLRASGLRLTAAEYSMIQGVLALVFIGIGFLVFRALNTILIYKLLVFVLFLYIPVFGPKYYVRTKVKSRKENILRELPEVIDLLLVSVEAGMGLDAAIMRLYSKGKNSAVLTELAGSVRDVQMGLSRKNSLREMAERCDVKELSSFVSALIQAEQLGVSIKNVLANQSARLREERRQRVKEKAMKAPIKMMLPTVGFIFPVMFIILLGPAAVNLFAAFS